MSTIRIKQFQDKACLSYLVVSEGEGVLIDPHFNLTEEYGKALANGVRLVAVIDTHTHADHISSAVLLGIKYGVQVHMSENAITQFAKVSVKGGDEIKFGTEKLSVLPTPGHTDDSLCVHCQGNLFSGDTLLIGSIGRCDFQNGSPEDMHQSLTQLRENFTPETVLHPGHSYTDAKKSNLGEESIKNPFFTPMEQSDFVAMVTAKSIPKPTDMERIVATNQRGARELRSKTPEEAQALLADDDWLMVDVRNPDEFYSLSVEGSRNIPLQGFGGYVEELSSLGKKVIITCNSGPRARSAAEQLQASPIEVYLLEGALVAWQKEKRPLIRKGPRYPLQQQVFMVAGSIVVLGVVLSYLFSSLWLLLSLFVGCGLFMAGLTGVCPMANILLQMPWNKVEGETGGGCSLGSTGGGCSL